MARKSNTRAASGTGSIRQRPDGRWEARITIGTDPGTGKTIRRSVYGDTQKEVRKRMTEILRELDKGTYLTPRKITVSAWLEDWLQTFCVNKVRPLTYSTYAGLIKNHINPALGAVELQSLRGIQIQQLYNTLTERGLSAKTVRNVGVVLRKSLSVAMKQGLIQTNPCDITELPKVTQRKVTPLSDEDIPRFLSAIEDSPQRNAYALCLFAGLREGECLGLSWDQVDFKRGRITISQQLQHEKTKGGKHYISPYTKNGKARTIEPPAIAFEYLQNELVRQLENQLRAGALWKNPHNLVFTDEVGECIHIHTFYIRFKRIVASIGRPDARPHDLRHTAATVAIASGADIKSVQDLMGHATASFTLNVYAHTSEQMMKDTASRMQSYYDSLKRVQA